MLQPQPTKIGRVVTRFTDLPSLPKVVEKLLHLTDKASTREFADIIATDQGLSAKVLRLVNSAFYSLRAPISSLRHASSLLGVRTLKSLALSVSVIQIFKRSIPGFDPLRFWRHSLSVAMVGQKVAEKIRLGFPDEVYIAGLLHDTGIALMVQHYPAEYAKVALPGTEGLPETLARETETFGLSHTEVGFNLASHWRLPSMVGLGIRHHHTTAELPREIDPDTRKLIDLVRFADGFARRAGFSFAEVDHLDPAAPLPEFPDIGLDPETLQAAAMGLEQSIQDMESLFLEIKAQEKAPA